MKTFITCLFIIFSLQTFAQQIQKYYDYNWRECDASMARFVSVVKKTDSGWHRSDYFLFGKKLQMDGTYSDETCKEENGKFYYYHANGILEKVGNYVNGKKEDIWLNYYSNGMMSDSTVYKNGTPIGTSLGWHPNGFLKDSTVVNDNGRSVSIEWFDNGNNELHGQAFSRILDKIDPVGICVHASLASFCANGTKTLQA